MGKWQQFLMNNSNKSLSCRIARRADQQGARPPTRNQAGVEKSTTGTTSPNNYLAGNLTENFSQQGPPDAEDTSRSNKKASRQQWTREEYIQVTTAFHEAKLTPVEAQIQSRHINYGERNTRKADQRWMLYKLANVRRDIIKKKRLEDTTLQQLQNDIRETIERQNIENSSNDVEETEMQHETNVNDAPNTETLGRTNTNDSAPNDEINEISEKMIIKIEN